jgi:hypothetical protein
LSTESVRDEIARRAYFRYVARDRQHGADLDDWLHAERQLAREMAPPETKPRPAAKRTARSRSR